MNARWLQFQYLGTMREDRSGRSTEEMSVKTQGDGPPSNVADAFGHSRRVPLPVFVMTRDPLMNHVTREQSPRAAAKERVSSRGLAVNQLRL